MVAPFRRPETIDADGDQSVDRRQRRAVIHHAPDAAHHPTERPVADQNRDGQQRHRDDRNHEIGDGLVDDERGEVGAQFPLEEERKDDGEVGQGADGCEDEEKNGDDEEKDVDATVR